MTIWLQQQGYEVNRKRVLRLMRVMGLVGLAPGPNTSKPHPEHKVYPYLLRNIRDMRRHWPARQYRRVLHALVSPVPLKLKSRQTIGTIALANIFSEGVMDGPPP